ncbi:DUF1593 domain-containing protein [Streptomyces sp. NBC_00459]|uniref:DUF1593 domain-containing protein n=1 Tax=Streptomyces sp. NBC_00459 TaxID=2975749 RepID=UPI002E16E0FB
MGTLGRTASPLLALLLALGCLAWQNPGTAAAAGSAHDNRPRVLVSTDIGGTDPDDFQSMVHLLVYADRFDLEGLVSSPFGPGRKQDILDVIDLYEHDFPNLRTYSRRYPSPSALRAITKQGAPDTLHHPGYGKPTEGSRWLVEHARSKDPRPLNVLVWGGMDDLAQALHDAPDILPKLRVYFIGGPNKMWSVDAYDYIERAHPALWMIEANSTYRGWFTGGDQTGEWANDSFVSTHVTGRGTLGDFFATLLGGTLKMGDSPSVGRLLSGNAADPTRPGWGGNFARVWDGRKTVFNRLTTEADIAEAFGVVELVLPLPKGFTDRNTATLLVDNRIPAPGVRQGHHVRFRFSPRDAKVWPYVIQSDFAGLNGQSGRFTATPPPVERTRTPSSVHPHWWTDDPDPAVAEGVHAGAKTVNRWRVDCLRDFAARMLRCASPAPAEGRTDMQRQSQRS